MWSTTQLLPVRSVRLWILQVHPWHATRLAGSACMVGAQYRRTMSWRAALPKYLLREWNKVKRCEMLRDKMFQVFEGTKSKLWVDTGSWDQEGLMPFHVKRSAWRLENTRCLLYLICQSLISIVHVSSQRMQEEWHDLHHFDWTSALPPDYTAVSSLHCCSSGLGFHQIKCRILYNHVQPWTLLLEIRVRAFEAPLYEPGQCAYWVKTTSTYSFYSSHFDLLLLGISASNDMSEGEKQIRPSEHAKRRSTDGSPRKDQVYAYAYRPTDGSRWKRQCWSMERSCSS